MKEMGYWQHIRVQFCGAAIAFTACLVCSFTTSNAGIAGLVINFAIIINFYLGGWVYLIAESEAFLTSVERIGEYCDMDQEAARYVVEPFNKKNSNEWPLYGEVQFMDVCLRYRKDLPLALKNATFKVNKGTSTGVVGRTGAGKSTLAVALFRLFEIESGKILIDGVDIQKLGLMDVRRKLSIVSYIFLYSHKSIIPVEKIFSNIPLSSPLRIISFSQLPSIILGFTQFLGQNKSFCVFAFTISACGTLLFAFLQYVSN